MSIIATGTTNSIARHARSAVRDASASVGAQLMIRLAETTNYREKRRLRAMLRNWQDSLPVVRG